MKTEHGIVIGLIIGLLIGASIGYVITPPQDTSELERQLSESQSQISIQQTEKTALSEELDNTLDNLLTAQTEFIELNHSYIDLVEQNQALEENISQFQATLNEVQAEHEESKDELFSLRQELNQSSMPESPRILTNWNDTEFWQEILDMNISTSGVTARIVKKEYHVTSKQEVQEFLDFIGNTETYQEIPYFRKDAERKGHNVNAREFFLLGKLLEWSEGKLAVGLIVQWYTYPEGWYDYIGLGQRFLGIIVQENSLYTMYIIRAGPMPELVDLRLREVIFVWM